MNVNTISKILVVFGTRPEAIKMAPLVLELKKSIQFDVKLCVTGQHREMLDQVLDLFDLKPDYDLDIMKSNQTLTDVCTSILHGMGPVIKDYQPDRVIVHGDTATSFAATLAAYFHQVAVGHVEAGLRTGNIYSPWPEEGMRRLTAGIADQHYTPTVGSLKNLIMENVNPNTIFVTGNTVIDALMDVSSLIDGDKQLYSELYSRFNFINPAKKLILVTGHRRENHGDGFENICAALRQLAQRNDVEIVYPVHLNPNVQQPVKKHLAGLNNVHLIEPLDYLPFVYLMKQSYLILTDSGGIQEEAPTLGKPVLCMRKTTERPAAVQAGTVRLVGTEAEVIVSEVTRLLDDELAYQVMSHANNPYGDGTASLKIIDALLHSHHALQRQIDNQLNVR